MARKDRYPNVTQLRMTERQRRALQLLTAEAGVTNSEYLRGLLDAHIAELPKKWRDQLDLEHDEFVQTVASFLAGHQ